MIAYLPSSVIPLFWINVNLYVEVIVILNKNLQCEFSKYETISTFPKFQSKLWSILVVITGFNKYIGICA